MRKFKPSKLYGGRAILDVPTETTPRHRDYMFRVWIDKIRQFEEYDVADDWRYFSKAKSFIKFNAKEDQKLIFIGDCFDDPIICQDNLMYGPATLHHTTKRVAASNNYRWVIKNSVGKYLGYLKPECGEAMRGTPTTDPLEAHMEGIGFMIIHLENLKPRVEEPHKLDRIIERFKWAQKNRVPLLSHIDYVAPTKVEVVKEKVKKTSSMSIINSVFGASNARSSEMV